MAIDWNLLITVGLTLVALAAVVIALHMSRARAVRYQPSTMLAEMSSRLEELTLRVIEVELALSRYRVGTAQLIGQVETLGAVPVWRPEWIGRGGAPEQREPVLVRLYQVIAEHFSLSELETLMFEVGIAAEAVAGGDTVHSRSMALVQYAARHGLLDQLVAACRRARPREVWPLLTEM